MSTVDTILDEIDAALVENDSAFVDGYVLYSLNEIDNDLDELLRDSEFLSGLRYDSSRGELTVNATRIA